MARKTDKHTPPPPRGAYTLKEFAEAHGISYDMVRKLMRQGLAPRLMRIGRRPLISIEAAVAWRRDREAATAKREAATRPAPAA
jgi:hypothetical protein